MVKNKLKAGLFNPKTCIQIGILVNILLTAFKFIAGILGLSKAMIADALHSLSDILTSAVAYVGILIGQRPADDCHPYGHGNAETIAASIVSLVILVIGVWAGISSVMAIIHQQFKQPLNIALWAAFISILVKEGLFHYTIKVGEFSNSPAVVADAWHHRSDAYSSIAALLGIIGARLAWVQLDPIAGIVVSGLIAGVAFRLIRSNVGIIMDEKPQAVFLNNARAVVERIEEVRKIDNIKVHRRGSQFTIDLEIAVDRQLTVEQGHRIAANVRNKLLKDLQHISDAMVHVNPAKSKGR